MNPSDYDASTISIPFASVKFSSYIEEFQDKFSLHAKTSIPIIQIMTESLLRIWKLIFKSYSNVRNTENFNTDNIKHFVTSEISYAIHTWCMSSIDSAIHNSFRRLKSFVQYIDTNDPSDPRKSVVKQYIPRVIAVILRYPFNTVTESWAAKTHKLLHSIIHSCEERVVRLQSYNSFLPEDSPTQVDIDQLISQLPDNSLKIMQRQTKEKMNQALQTLVSTQKSPLNKNLLSSIYKDSKQFKYFAPASSNIPTSPSYLDSIQIESKRKSILLENITSLDRLNSGHWEENIERKSTRVRTNIDKRLRNNRTVRIMTKEYVKDSITEEPEGVKHDSQEISGAEGESDVEVEEVKEESEKEALEIAMRLEELAKIRENDVEGEIRPKFVRQNLRINDVMGRKRVSKLY